MNEKIDLNKYTKFVDAVTSKESNNFDHLLPRVNELRNTTNVNGLRTHHGTVTRQVKERYFCTDWDNFKKFVETEGSIDLLERRIHQRNFKEFMSERSGDGLPPGVNALREFDIVVRKASSTSETSV